jgi:pyruvate/2-oxoglutarate dehydrogenase complex dihydrolipoamide acyltransferase (E2) component
MSTVQIRAPRLNANDDSVTLSRLLVKTGDEIAAGALLAEIESDKATFEIRADQAGFVLRIDAQEGDSIETGAPILSIGASPDSQPNGATQPPEPAGAPCRKITAKARALLTEHNIEPHCIPAPDGIVTAALVEAYFRARPPGRAQAQQEIDGQAPPHDGKREPLSAAARAMIKTVAWQGQGAAPAYLELPFDHDGWHAYAQDFRETHGLLADPTLALLGHRLVALAKRHPCLNATLLAGSRFLYTGVHLGFAIRTKPALVMPILRHAERLDQAGFVQALHNLHKRALSGRLAPQELVSPTLSLSSLASTAVCRHIPILPPHTSLIVAHSARPASGMGTIGATYDHRLLDGDTVARALNGLTHPTLQGASDDGEMR